MNIWETMNREFRPAYSTSNSHNCLHQEKEIETHFPYWTEKWCRWIRKRKEASKGVIMEIM